jgi:hypothetical protein
VISHHRLDGLHILHPKPLEDILLILGLRDEGVVLELFDLRFEEIVPLTHHRYLELLHHNSAKFITRLLISIIKYNFIDIYLEHK